MTRPSQMETDWARLPGDHPQWYLDAYPLSYRPKNRVMEGPLSVNDFTAEIGNGNGIRKTIIYVHIPFCKSPCGYCELVKRPFEPVLADAFLKALYGQVRLMADSGLLGDTQCSGISFGGGTPTTLAADDLVHLFQTFRQTYHCSSDFSCTIEANPATCDRESLETLYGGGMSRISFGMQTFDSQVIQFLGCGHTVDQGRWAVREARRAGFSNINIDMLYGLPGQEEAGLVRDLEEALQLDLECYTFYPIAVYPGSKLYRRIGAGLAPPLPPREAIDEMTDRIDSFFTASGYQRFWLNQYIRTDRCRRPGGLSPVNYLAFGCGAYGTFRGMSYFVNPNLDQYIDQVDQSFLPFLFRTKISDTEWAVRKFYDAYLRLDVDWRDFSDGEKQVLKKLLEQYSTWGLWEEEGHHLVPTALGRHRADAFIQMLLTDSVHTRR